jgi:predicted phage baseplate assembly protein
VLADQGMQIAPEALGTVPLATTATTCRGLGLPADIQIQGGAFQPVLKSTPLTFRQPMAAQAPAAGLLLQDPRLCNPQIILTSIPPQLDGSGPFFRFADLQDSASLAARLANPIDGASRALREQLSAKTRSLLSEWEPGVPVAENISSALSEELQKLVRRWIPQRDLLSSQPQDLHFVVEIDDQGFAHLRFGNGVCGRAPQAGESFEATYRIGNGPSANVGAETITQVVSKVVLGGMTLRPRNPLAASGGTAQQSIEEVKLFAPGAFQNRLERAITADDYATLAERDSRVQRAAAELQWTGTCYEAHVAIDPLGTVQFDPDLLEQIRAYLHPYRRIGHDLVVVPAQYVPLDIAMSVDVSPNYIRAHVQASLLDLFSNRVLSSGGKGFFHPDNLSFGDSIRLSSLIAAAQSVEGVLSVTLTKLERLFAGPNHEVEEGLLSIGPLEVGRLDNDPGFPENGRFVLTLRGGR